MKRMIVVAWAVLGLLGCEERELKLCDITKSDCQESIYYADLRVRGDGYDPFGGIPPIRTVTEVQLRAELQAEADQSAQDPNTQEAWGYNAFALLKLMPPASDKQDASLENFVKHTAAYYDPSTRKVTVIAHPADPNISVSTTQFRGMVTLAHELVHALQDRELKLKFDLNVSTDETFAIKAIIEGDATVYEYLFIAELNPTVKQKYPSPLSYAIEYRTLFMADGPKFENSEEGVNFASLGPPALAAMALVYPLGGIWLAEHYAKGGNSAVRHAYAEAPKRSLDFLLPFGTEVAANTNTACVPPPPLNQGFAGRGRDILGAVQFYAFMMGQGVLSNAAAAAASLWRNDMMFVSYNVSTKKTAVAWRIELAQPIAAATLAQITTADGPRVVQDGNTLLITASDDAEVKANWKPSTSCR